MDGLRRRLSAPLPPPEKVIEELKRKETFQVGEGLLSENALRQLKDDQFSVKGDYKNKTVLIKTSGLQEDRLEFNTIERFFADLNQELGMIFKSLGARKYILSVDTRSSLEYSGSGDVTDQFNQLKLRGGVERTETRSFISLGDEVFPNTAIPSAELLKRGWLEMSGLKEHAQGVYDDICAFAKTGRIPQGDRGLRRSLLFTSHSTFSGKFAGVIMHTGFKFGLSKKKVIAYILSIELEYWNVQDLDCMKDPEKRGKLAFGDFWTETYSILGMIQDEYIKQKLVTVETGFIQNLLNYWSSKKPFTMPMEFVLVGEMKSGKTSFIWWTEIARHGKWCEPTRAPRDLLDQKSGSGARTETAQEPFIDDVKYTFMEIPGSEEGKRKRFDQDTQQQLVIAVVPFDTFEKEVSDLKVYLSTLPGGFQMINAVFVTKWDSILVPANSVKNGDKLLETLDEVWTEKLSEIVLKCEEYSRLLNGIPVYAVETPILHFQPSAEALDRMNRRNIRSLNDALCLMLNNLKQGI